MDISNRQKPHIKANSLINFKMLNPGKANNSTQREKAQRSSFSQSKEILLTKSKDERSLPKIIENKKTETGIKNSLKIHNSKEFHNIISRALSPQEYNSVNKANDLKYSLKKSNQSAQNNQKAAFPIQNERSVDHPSNFKKMIEFKTKIVFKEESINKLNLSVNEANIIENKELQKNDENHLNLNNNRTMFRSNTGASKTTKECSISVSKIPKIGKFKYNIEIESLEELHFIYNNLYQQNKILAEKLDNDENLKF